MTCSSMARRSFNWAVTASRKKPCTVQAAPSRPRSPRNLPPDALCSRLPPSPKLTSPKPSKRAIPSAKAASHSTTSTASALSLLPAVSTKFPSTACTPPPNPPPTEKWPHLSSIRSSTLHALCLSAFRFLLFVNDPSAHDRGGGGPLKRPPIEWRGSRLSPRFFFTVAPRLNYSKKCHVASPARGDTS